MHMDRRYSLTVIGQRLCGTLAAGVIVVAAISCTRNPTRDKQRFFESGERYFRMNKCPEAVIQYRNALQVDPRYSEAYFRLGVCYASLERWSDAFNAWQETVQLDPSHIEAHLHLAELYLNSRDENNAEKQASIVLAQDRDNATAYQILGASLVAGGNKEDALRAFRQITKLRTQDPSAYTNSGLVEIGLGRLADAETDLRKAVDVDSSYVVGYINLANFYWLQGDLRTAEGVLREGAAHNPGSAQINVHLAENLHAQMKDDAVRNVLMNLRQRSPHSTEVALAVGDFFLEQEQYDAAETEYREGLRAAPANLELQRRMVEVQVDRGDIRDAGSVNDAILHKNPHDAIALINHGRILMALRKTQDALNELQRYNANTPDSPLAHYYLGLAFQQSGDSAGAKDQFRRVLVLNPDFAPALYSLAELELGDGESAQAVDYATRCFLLQPSKVSNRLLLGIALLKNGSPAKAREQFLFAQQLDPKNPSVHLNLALVSIAQPNLADAEAELETALRLDPSFDDALGELVDLLVTLKQEAKALSTAQAAVASDPGNPGAHLVLGSLLATLMKYPAAESELAEAVRLDPNFVAAYLKLGWVKQERQQLDAAVTYYQKALELQPRSAPLHALLGDVYIKKQDLRRAEQYYQQALTLDPDFVVAEGNLAWIYATENMNLDLALKLATHARQRLPQLDSISDTLAWVYYKRGDYTSAIPLFEECVHSDPGAAVYHYHLGLALIANGNSQQGKQQLTSALQLNLSNAESDIASRLLAR